MPKPKSTTLTVAQGRALLAKRGKRSAASIGTRKGQAIAQDRAKRFVMLCAANRLPQPTTEYRFWPERRFMFDFAWPVQGIALESEGGVWSGGRHTSGAGFKRDCTKYNEAALRGWTVLRVLSSELCTEETISLVKRAMLVYSTQL